MEINNTQDVIDSRDVIDRIEELEEIETPDSEETEELETLENLAIEAGSSPDWEHGETLIRESYFVEYCEELCKDIGEIPKELPWYIANHIDWDGVAREIKMDYMEVDFDGVSYFIRA